MKSILVFVVSLSLLSLFSAFEKLTSEINPTIEIMVTEIRNGKGNLVMGFYKDSKSFSKQEPFMSKVVEKTTMKNGVVKFAGFLLPIEGFGFSDYYHTGVFAPTFKDFDFEVTDTDKRVTVKLKYM